MTRKDYYQILELEATATPAEIKKAYRKLAQQYHPDKNNNDPYATGRFTEIKEAYETLINPAKKGFYLQQQWYNQGLGQRKKQGIMTPVTLLKQALELDKYVSKLDIHRMDKEGLYTYIKDLISDEGIEKLNVLNDRVINKEITQTILHCGRLLPVALVILLHERLMRINNDASTTEQISQYLKIHQKAHQRDKYRVWVILLIVILLCLLIYIISR
jgi:molecular chaperone DnaJ